MVVMKQSSGLITTSVRLEACRAPKRLLITTIVRLERVWTGAALRDSRPAAGLA